MWLGMNPVHECPLWNVLLSLYASRNHSGKSSASFLGPAMEHDP